MDKLSEVERADFHQDYFKSQNRASHTSSMSGRDVLILVCLLCLGFCMLGIGMWNYRIEVRLKKMEHELMTHKEWHMTDSRTRTARQNAVPTPGRNSIVMKEIASAHVIPCVRKFNPRVSDFTVNGFIRNFWAGSCGSYSAFAHLHGNMSIIDGAYLVVPRSGLYHVYGQIGLKRDAGSTAGGFYLIEVCFNGETPVPSNYVTLEKFSVQPEDRKPVYPFVAGTFKIREGCGFGIRVDHNVNNYRVSNQHTRTFLGAFLVDEMSTA
jgi:hypothetical protein